MIIAAQNYATIKLIQMRDAEELIKREQDEACRLLIIKITSEAKKEAEEEKKNEEVDDKKKQGEKAHGLKHDNENVHEHVHPKQKKEQHNTRAT